MEVWKQFRAVLLLPGVVLVVIPVTIIYLNGLDTFGLWRSAPVIRIVLALLGLAFVAGELILMVSTIRLFATVGQGTLAPWNPQQRLVVRGIYRHVRNPMMMGVGSILFGEALLTSSLPMLCWFAFLVTMVLIAIPLVEEPGLVKRFGDDYVAYKRNVPRWIPRRTPWQAEQPGNGG